MSWLQIIACLGLFFLIGSTSAGKEDLFYSGYKGKYLGEFSPYLTEHDIAGKAYAINETALVVVGFAYNAAVSTAYFFADSSFQPGVIVPIDPFDEQLSLGKYDPHKNGAFVILRLPNPITSYERLSVRSDTSTVNFAEVLIPPDFDPPQPRQVGTTFNNSVWAADAVYIVNNRQIFFENLDYDGSCTEAYYWVGKGIVDSNGHKALNENLRPDKLAGSFSNQDVTVTLPRPLDISDVDYIAIWCSSNGGRSLGRVTISNDTANISSYIDEPYLGKYLGFFNFDGSVSNNQHRARGSVFANDDRTLVITDFTFDGTAPSTFIWGSAGDIGDPDGDIFPVDNSFAPLGYYEHDDIFVKLPLGKTLADYGSISVYCRTAAANFGLLVIPDDFEFPAPKSLGELGFTPRVHNVHADDVEVIDKYTFLIRGLSYDGYGRSTYFWVGTGDTPDKKGWKAFWEYASKEEEEEEEDDYYGDPRPVPYDGIGFDGNVDIYVRLPHWLTVFDIGYIGLWCIPFRQDFGHVDIPDTDDSLCIPAYSDLEENYNYNCEVLKSQEFNVHWNIDGDKIYITMEGRIKGDEYLTFGLSGSESETNMIGSDVVVGWIESQYNSGGYVQDYNLTSREQCVISGQYGRGACPDERSSGTQDVELEYASYYDGIATISYSRLLDTGDRNSDKIIPLDEPVYIVWAIGRIDENGQIYKHRAATAGNHRIHFGRHGSVCPPLDPGPGPDLPPWPQPVIFADSPNLSKPFRATIGPSGGRRGYDAITGVQGWGIVWYINDLLIPVITVKRGVTYTFEVYGGNDPSSPAAYHPFYITKDPIGGEGQRGRQNNETYPGPVEGPLCEWKSNGAYSPDEFHNFFEYRDETLEEDCEPGAPGILQWTPDADTPDIVYYQCYTHRSLGWKIKVVDEIPDCEADEFECEEVKHERCIDQAKMCDGYVDCGGPQDELNCPVCVGDLYRCQQPRPDGYACILPSAICDGVADCLDAEDEDPQLHNCPDPYECNDGYEFTCDNQLCVLNSFLCDGQNDCGDNSDEGAAACSAQLPAVIASATLPLDEEFRPEYRDLTSPEFQQAAADFEEAIFTHLADYFGNALAEIQVFGFRQGSLIPFFTIVFNYPPGDLSTAQQDIENILLAAFSSLTNSGTLGSFSVLPGPVPPVSVEVECDFGYFSCHNHLCIPYNNVCDTNDDCGDASDELNCDICPSGVPLTTCPAGPCSISACTGSASCSDEFCANCHTLYFDARGSPIPRCTDCPIEVCTLEWNPQCGSDGITYGNPCALAGAACRDPGLSLAYPGACVANPCGNQPCQNGGTCIAVAADYICQCRSGFTGTLCEILPDTCPRSAPLVACLARPCFVSPACPGSYRCDDVYCGGCTAIFYDISGNPLPNCYECPVLACTREWNPQCGSDGVTYGNPCELAAAACSDPTLTLAYLGECIGTPCSIQPCQNGGSCIDVPTSTGYVCICPAEYTGTYCQIPVIIIDPCEGQPCQNGGTCIETTVGYICRCRTGFTGSTCEILPDICPLAAPLVACFAQPCSVSPACPGSYRCEDVYCGGCTAIYFDSYGNPLPECYECPILACTLEWNPQCGSDGVTYGNPCALAAAACNDPSLALAYSGECIGNACESNPCMNGGVCGRLPSGYFCQCWPGFTGSICELPITGTICDRNPCLNGGTCEVSTGSQGYFCRCPPAFVGTRCETMISVNVCSSQPCQNGGSCEESAGGYRCRCPAGYAGPLCEIRFPVNPCDSRPCQNGGTCMQMSSTTYVCRCIVGYTGIACEMTTSGCQVVCETDEFDPHCGSDGTTYTTLCELERAKTCFYPELRLQYPGECRPGGCPQGVPTVRCIADPCEINQCPNYPNAQCLASYCGGCFAHFFEENGNPITECSGCPIEFCTLEWDPQCGSNGLTYGNPCKLSAAACSDRYLTLDYPGECQSGCPFDTCTAEYNPVCGTNGVSYTNPCWLDVASCRDSSIALRHDGPCRPFPPGCPIDFCTEEYNPRCGLDGHTYSNPCYFAQEVCHNPGLRLAYEGECRSGCPITECPDDYDPQCGTNGQTYTNLCELNAAACFAPFLQRAHEGQCGPAPRPWPVASVGYDGNIKFIVEIGDAGGLRGYTGITGYPSPGIAWYINGQLIPVITVQRGLYYVFQVSGGRDHGFYITNDSMGGYRIQTSEERQNVIIYAGPVDGPLCEWKAVSGMSPDSFGSFAAFSQAGLSRTCEEGEPGLLVWRPDETTPDVLYYQSYNERYVGWKIRVVNQLPRSSSNVIASTKISLLLMSVVAMVFTYLQL